MQSLLTVSERITVAGNTPVEQYARASLEIAKDIAEARPELLIYRVRSAFPLFYTTYHALRKKVGLVAEKYDPVVDFLPTSSLLQPHLEKLQERYKPKKVFVLDSTSTGMSIGRQFLLPYHKELRALTNDITIELLSAGSLCNLEDLELKHPDIIASFKFKVYGVNFSTYDLFEDRPTALGIEVEREEKVPDSKRNELGLKTASEVFSLEQKLMVTPNVIPYEGNSDKLLLEISRKIDSL